MPETDIGFFPSLGRGSVGGRQASMGRGMPSVAAIKDQMKMWDWRWKGSLIYKEEMELEWKEEKYLILFVVLTEGGREGKWIGFYSVGGVRLVG